MPGPPLDRAPSTRQSGCFPLRLPQNVAACAPTPRRCPSPTRSASSPSSRRTTRLQTALFWPARARRQRQWRRRRRRRRWHHLLVVPNEASVDYVARQASRRRRRRDREQREFKVHGDVGAKFAARCEEPRCVKTRGPRRFALLPFAPQRRQPQRCPRGSPEATRPCRLGRRRQR